MILHLTQMLIFLIILENAKSWHSFSGNATVPSIIQLRALDMWRLEMQWMNERDLHQNQTYEIQVGRTKNMDIIDTMSVSAGAGAGADAAVWRSQLPLNCADHSVRIRRISDGSTRGPWSPWKTNYGDENLSQNKIKLYPRGQVLKEGSSLLFCCIYPKEVHVTSMFFNNTSYKAIDISPQVKAIWVERLNATNVLGINFYCGNGSRDGALNFVTFPPEKPQDIQCETSDLRSICCWWKVHRAPNLGGSRRRKYDLTIRDSETVSCDLNRETNLVSCSFPVIKSQIIYNITLRETNSLGQESEHYTFNITDRVFPVPEHSAVTSGAFDAVIVLLLNGSFKGLSIVCQIKVEPGRTIKEEQKNHADSVQLYTFSIQQLQPSVTYTATGRCAVQGNDWGRWTQPRSFATEPLVTVDLWRRIRENPNRTVTVLWNTVKTDSKLYVEAYEVCKSHGDPQRRVCINVTHTRVDLTLGVHVCDITVRAVTRKGSSIPSHITIPPAYTAGGLLKKKRIMGDAEGFALSWARDSAGTCDYTVEWCMLGDPGTLQWRKVPVNQTFLSLKARDFKPGVRYAFTIYGCKTEGYRPHEIQIGYLKELKPLQWPTLDPDPKVTWSSVTLNWSFNEEDASHTGFITRYEIFMKDLDGEIDPSSVNRQSTITVNAHSKSFTFSGLEEDHLYEFHLAACSSAGCGPETTGTFRTRKNYYLLSAKILVPLLVLVGCSFCLYSCRKTLKEISGEFNFVHIKALDLDEDLYEASEKIRNLRIEDCNWCDVEIIDVKKTWLMSPEDRSLSSISPKVTGPSFLKPSNQLTMGMWDGQTTNFTNFTYVSAGQQDFPEEMFETSRTDGNVPEPKNSGFTSDYVASI